MVKQIRIKRPGSQIWEEVTEQQLREYVSGNADEHQTIDSTTATLQHKREVAENLLKFSQDLQHRAIVHDNSKLEDPEKPHLDRVAYENRNGSPEYGSPEYDQQKQSLQPFLDHHYEHNSHHPEHYPGGVNQMNLSDVIEMVCDWMSAAKRGNQGVIDLTTLSERYKIDPMLKNIIGNTLENLYVDFK